MNDTTSALVKAGVKLPPQNQRIWQWLKDNGPHGVKDLASELKIGEGTTHTAISIMVRRKMLEKVERKDHKGIRLNNHYGALGKVFVRLPEPVKKGMAGVQRVEPLDVYPVAKEAPVFSPEKLLADCTLMQMHQVYDFLKRWFK